MSGTKAPAMATLVARLAARDMLGFRVKAGIASQAVTKVGQGKTGQVKPARPVGPARD